MSSNQDFWYRIAKSSLPIIFVVTFTILVIGFLVRDTVRDHDREVMQRRNIINLQQKFAEEIAVAKRVTADPCGTVFYKVVTPPPEINDSSRLIMMGAEVSSIDSYQNQLFRQTFYYTPGLGESVNGVSTFSSQLNGVLNQLKDALSKLKELI